MEIGDRVQVNNPAWKDAAGNEYPPRKNHGKNGVIVDNLARKIGKVGADFLLMIRFDDGSVAPHWISELKILERE